MANFRSARASGRCVYPRDADLPHFLQHRLIHKVKKVWFMNGLGKRSHVVLMCRNACFYVEVKFVRVDLELLLYIQSMPPVVFRLFHNRSYVQNWIHKIYSTISRKS